jgi:His-Xaa-Ser system radical SAM maturase HxsC
MCSQPPKKNHVDMFRHFAAAVVLAPASATIGISGGEPTLYKGDLFHFLELALTLRPDLRFHVLSNAQHFVEDDIDFLRSDLAQKIQWGVPLYAADASLHDQIVGKVGAFERLEDGLAILCRAGAPLELRTVVMQQNVAQLADTARYIAAHIPFADPWAIMQLENIGFARNRWGELFFDHSVEFTPVANAVDIARVHGLPAILYNFPLCTVPRQYRRFAPSTISDWKRRFEDRCEGCIAKPHCGGFFEWHPDQASYQHLGMS